MKAGLERSGESMRHILPRNGDRLSFIKVLDLYADTCRGHPVTLPLQPEALASDWKDELSAVGAPHRLTDGWRQTMKIKA